MSDEPMHARRTRWLGGAGPRMSCMLHAWGWLSAAQRCSITVLWRDAWWEKFKVDASVVSAHGGQESR